ncbi:Fructose-bisphosphate aldolase class I [hydrothermal vent metagenome]|uniref:fructose-bisphosphate aldolase n=1 Tax=hydrothermal vent metagenome TaxID=652676 RepID=A0A3B0UPU7_9ZZZZ
MYDLHEIALNLVAHKKGLLAADESIKTAGKRLVACGVESTAETRRQYRELFLDTPSIEKYLSGVILFEETLKQSSDSGVPFPELLEQKGILPGIKVDQGTELMTDSSNETVTKGLLDLEERLAPYRASGARFTKWRAVIRIDGDTLPSAKAIMENAKRLASYALTAQQSGFVPILEPEVLLEGNHSRLRTKDVIEATMNAVFSAVDDIAVDRTALIIKTSMALSGSDSGRTDTPEEVADSTVEALKACIPADVPGIVFLSGGQSPDQATNNLSAIMKLAHKVGVPWNITFSYARALQSESLSVWKGEKDNMQNARTVFLERLVKVTDALPDVSK